MFFQTCYCELLSFHFDLPVVICSSFISSIYIIYQFLPPTLFSLLILFICVKSSSVWPMLWEALYRYLYTIQLVTLHYEESVVVSWSGGEALVSCGIMESLLRVINWFGDDGQDHITVSSYCIFIHSFVMNSTPPSLCLGTVLFSLIGVHCKRRCIKV